VVIIWEFIYRNSCFFDLLDFYAGVLEASVPKILYVFQRFFFTIPLTLTLSHQGRGNFRIPPLAGCNERACMHLHEFAISKILKTLMVFEAGLAVRKSREPGS
jgi:hypothetical protein